MSNLSLDRILAYEEDTAHASGDEGVFFLGVTQSSLSASAGDNDYSAIKLNSKGELYTIDTDGNALLTTIDADTGAIAVSVASIDTDTTTIAGDTTSIDAAITALSHAESSTHSSGQKGVMSLAVRNDAETALAADGEYIPLMTNSSGKLLIAGDLNITSPNTAIKSTAVTVGVTEVKLPAVPIAGREEITIQNKGPNPIYLGPTGVTTSTGIEVGKRSNMTLTLGSGVDVFGISGVAGNDVRAFEIS